MIKRNSSWLWFFICYAQCAIGMSGSFTYQQQVFTSPCMCNSYWMQQPVNWVSPSTRVPSSPSQETCNGVPVYTSDQLHAGVQFTLPEDHQMVFHWGDARWAAYCDKAGIKTADQACGAYCLFQYPSYQQFLEHKFSSRPEGGTTTTFQTAYLKHCDKIATDKNLQKQIDRTSVHGGSIAHSMLAEAYNVRLTIQNKQLQLDAQKKLAEQKTAVSAIRQANCQDSKQLAKASAQIKNALDAAIDTSKTQQFASKDQLLHELDKNLQASCETLQEYIADRDLVRSSLIETSLVKTEKQDCKITTEHYETHQEQLQSTLRAAGIDNTFDTCNGTALAQETHIDQVVLLRNVSDIYHNDSIDPELKDVALRIAGLVEQGRKENSENNVSLALALQNVAWKAYDCLLNLGCIDIKLAISKNTPEKQVPQS